MTTFSPTSSNNKTYLLSYQINIWNNSSVPVSYNLPMTLLDSTSQGTSDATSTDYTQTMSANLQPLSGQSPNQGTIPPGGKIAFPFNASGLLQSGNTPILAINGNLGVYCRLWSGGVDLDQLFSGVSQVLQDAYGAAQDVLQAAEEAEEDPLGAMVDAVKGAVGVAKTIYALAQVVFTPQNQYINMNSPNNASWWASVNGSTFASVVGCGYRVTVDGGGGSLNTNNIVFQVYDYTGSNQLCLLRSTNGTWVSGGVAPLVLQAGPALAVLQDTLYAVVQSPNSNSSIASNMYYMSVTSLASSPGAKWSAPIVIPNQATASGPALGIFNNQLVLAFQGVNNNYINIMTSADGASWGTPVQIPGMTTLSTPALAAFNGALFIAFAGVGNNSINIMSTTNPMSWSGKPLILSQTTTSGLALAVFQNTLFMAYSGVGNNQVNIISSTDGATWTSPTLLTQTSSNGSISKTTTPSGMSMAVFNNTLYLAFQGSGNNEINVVSSSDGSTWGQPQTLSQFTTQAAPALVVFMEQMIMGYQGS